MEENYMNKWFKVLVTSIPFIFWMFLFLLFNETYLHIHDGYLSMIVMIAISGFLFLTVVMVSKEMLGLHPSRWTHIEKILPIKHMKYSVIHLLVGGAAIMVILLLNLMRLTENPSHFQEIKELILINTAIFSTLGAAALLFFKKVIPDHLNSFQKGFEMEGKEAFDNLEKIFEEMSMEYKSSKYTFLGFSGYLKLKDYDIKVNLSERNARTRIVLVYQDREKVERLKRKIDELFM